MSDNEQAWGAVLLVLERIAVATERAADAQEKQASFQAEARALFHEYKPKMEAMMGTLPIPPLSEDFRASAWEKINGGPRPAPRTMDEAFAASRDGEQFRAEQNACTCKVVSSEERHEPDCPALVIATLADVRDRRRARARERPTGALLGANFRSLGRVVKKKD